MPGYDMEHSMDSLRDPYQMSTTQSSLMLPGLRHGASSSDVSLTTVESNSSINSVVNLYEQGINRERDEVGVLNLTMTSNYYVFRRVLQIHLFFSRSSTFSWDSVVRPLPHPSDA